MGTIFLAGIYGVGKSTLANKLSIRTNIPNYSAGDLISTKMVSNMVPIKLSATKTRIKIFLPRA